LRAESARDRRSDQTVSLPSVSGFVPNQIPQGDPAMPAITQQPSIVNKLRPKTISPVTAGSPMTQPLQQPRIPGIAGLIQGVRNPDVAYAMGQPVTSQHLGSNAYQQGQSQARLAERPGYSPPPMVPQPAGMATQRPAPGITGSSPAVSPQGMPAPGAGSLAQRLTTPQAGMAQGGEMPRQMAAAAPGMAPSAPIPATPPAFNTPYYQQRAARNATGQGSPVAGMAATRSDAPVAAPPGPATTMPETEVTASRPVRQLRTPLPQDNPSDYDAFRQYNATGQQPTTTYSGSGREQFNPMNKLPQAANREGIVSRLNGGLGGTQTFQQAIGDRAGFNPGGHQFGGAKLSEQNGRAQFVSDDRPPALAGGAASAGEALVKRLEGYGKLEAGGSGYYDPNIQAFVGRGARTFASDGPGMGGLAGRLQAGGVTPSALSQEQLAANKAGMLSRLGVTRKDAMGKVQENAAAETLARNQRLGNVPTEQPLSPMMAQLQLAREGNLSREKIAGIGGQGDAQRNQMGFVAALLGNEKIDPQNIPALLQVLGGQGQGQGQGQGGGVPPGGIAELFKPKQGPEVFAGFPQAKVDEFQKLIDDGATPDDIARRMREENMTPQHANIALNRFFPGMFGSTQRSLDDPSGWGNMAEDTVIDPQTGNPVKSGLLGRLLGFARDPGVMGSGLPKWLRPKGTSN
jgi:hypothetical protein